jgi:O-antigen ligase
MGATLTAIVLGTLCVAAAYFFRPKGYAVFMRAAAFWVAALPVIMIFNAPLIELGICAAILLLLTPSKPDDRVAYYVLILPAVPAAIAGPIPFPGINFLITLDFPKVACLVLLAPLLFAATRGAGRRIPPAGAAFIVLSIFYALQAVQAASITEGLRTFVNTLLLYAIPYLALARAVSGLDSFDKIVAALLFLALIYAAIAAASQLRSWNFYSLAAMDFSAVTERYGLIRIGATSAPFILGYVAFLGLLAVDYFRRDRRMRAGSAWLMRAIFIAALAVTVSRGAWLSAAVGLAVFWFFTRMPRGARPAMLGLGLIVGAPLAIAGFYSADFSAVDEFGTFEYRQEVVRLSLEQIREKPLFGDVFFLENPRFQKLIQGQGIVDIVNHYLEIALMHGLVGLGLFSFAWLSVLGGLLSLGKIVRTTKSVELERQRAYLLAALVAMLVMFATTSATSISTHVSIALLGVAGGFVARERTKAAAVAPSPAAGFAQGDLEAAAGR